MSVHKKKPTHKKRPRPVLPLRWVNHSLDPALSRFKQYLPVQRTWMPADTVSADEMNQNVRDAINFCLSPPRCHVTMSVLTQSVQAVQQTGSVMTPLTFDTVLVDSDNMWDSNVPSRLNFSTPGLYKWRLYLHWAARNSAASYFAGVARVCAGTWPVGSYAADLTSPKMAEDEQQGVQSTGSVGVTNYLEGFYRTTAQDDYIEAFCSHTVNNNNVNLQAATFQVRLISQN